MSDISSMEMLHYLVGEVTSVRADEIDAHLVACQTCRREVDRLRGMIDRLDEPDDELECLDLVGMVRKKIKSHGDEERQRRNLPAVMSIVAALVVVVALGIYWIASPGGGDGFRVKSSGALIPEQDRWVALKAYKLDESGQPSKLAPSMKRSDFLLFAYTNLGEQPKSYLMIFAVDSMGRVYWLHPAYADESNDPVSIGVEANVAKHELPERIRHDYAPGQLWIYGLFTSEPKKVSDIVEVLAGLKPGERLPISGSAQHILKTVVRP